MDGDGVPELLVGAEKADSDARFLDDDGLDDIAISAPYGDGASAADAGAIYIFYGR